MCTPATITLPISANLTAGDSVKIIGKSGAWTLGLNEGQVITSLDLNSSAGGLRDSTTLSDVLYGRLPFLPSGIPFELTYIGNDKFLMSDFMILLLLAGR